MPRSTSPFVKVAENERGLFAAELATEKLAATSMMSLVSSTMFGAMSADPSGSVITRRLEKLICER